MINKISEYCSITFIIIFQQLMKMNIFLCKRTLFRETAQKAIVLNYDVINDVMMTQCIHQ